MATLKVLRQEQTGVVYADPSDPNLTVRFRNTTSNKTLNGVQTKNYLTEIIVNDDNSVTVGGVAAQDALSVRVRVSGTNESQTRIGAILTALGNQLATWHGEKVFVGFNPTTAPVIGS